MVNSGKTSLYLVKQPRQTRSNETMSHMLDAAMQILENKSFEKMTIAEVVKRADCSVGAFYGRFQDKDALLQALDERFFERFDQAIQEFLAPDNLKEKPLAEIIEGAARLLVETYSEQKGLLRSLNLKARLHNDSRFQKREQKSWGELFPKLQKILLSHRDKITHPYKILAIRLGFQQMFFTMREILLWEPFREVPPYDKEELISELAYAYLAYLGVQKDHS